VLRPLDLVPLPHFIYKYHPGFNRRINSVPAACGQRGPTDAVDAGMPRRVQTTSDGVGGRHHVRHGEQQRSDAHHHRAETDPARDVATTTQVAHDDRRQDAADLHRRRDQARVRAADLEPLLDGRDDAVHVAGRQRTCTSALIVFKRFFFTSPSSSTRSLQRPLFKHIISIVQQQTNISIGRNPGTSWNRLPGRPRKTGISQDSG